MGLSGSFALPVLRTVAMRASCRAMTPSVFNPCFIRGVISNSLAESTLRAALTPALSHGNRENRTPLCGESNAPGRASASALNRGAHRASGSDVRLEQDAGCLFPLP